MMKVNLKRLLAPSNPEIAPFEGDDYDGSQRGGLTSQDQCVRNAQPIR